MKRFFVVTGLSVFLLTSAVAAQEDCNTLKETDTAKYDECLRDKKVEQTQSSIKKVTDLQKKEKERAKKDFEERLEDMEDEKDDTIDFLTDYMTDLEEYIEDLEDRDKEDPTIKEVQAQVDAFSNYIDGVESTYDARIKILSEEQKMEALENELELAKYRTNQWRSLYESFR